MKQQVPIQINAKYIPALDGLRGIAILVVVLSHYGFGNILPGGFGVTLFFFISGFLITRLLIAEYQKDETISLKGFYIRRMLRLYPALLFMLLVSVVFTLMMGCSVNPQDILSTLFYYRNYYMIYVMSLDTLACSKVFGIVWSLAVEEHFYIVFPLLFLALFRWYRAFVIFLIVALIAALYWRLHIVAEQGLNEMVVMRIYRLTDTRFDAILYGCLVSLVLFKDDKQRYLRFAGHKLVFGITLALLFVTFLYRDLAFRETYRYSLQGVILSLLIPALLYHPNYTRVLRQVSSPWLITVGKYSYSLYMFHWVGVCVAEYYVSPLRDSALWIIVAMSVGLILTFISYNYVEKPMLSIRKRFGSNVPETLGTHVLPPYSVTD